MGDDSRRGSDSSGAGDVLVPDGRLGWLQERVVSGTRVKDSAWVRGTDWGLTHFDSVI
jgi:hypothetical protein